MPKTTTIKPAHKAIQRYHQALKEYGQQGVKHEGALETAFQRLLEEIARLHHCQLVPKQKLKVGAHLCATSRIYDFIPGVGLESELACVRIVCRPIAL